MGFGDPDHQHPLNLQVLRSDEEATCFRCELPLDRGWNYGCTGCHHFVHVSCAKLPRTMPHPLHHGQHPLVLVEPSSSQVPVDCSHCHNSCQGKYTYQCPTCPSFNLHLKCFLFLDLQTKHHHPLRLCDVGFSRADDIACRACGLLVDDGFTFTCEACQFHIHLECTLVPPAVKHHHVHELTFKHNYPEESDLAYCDVCEDRDGKELDRSLSYYYCKTCDYIAHVRCVTPQPCRDTVQLEHVHHEHPLIYSRKARAVLALCAACKGIVNESFYRCSQCSFVLHKSCADFPSLLKHPRHEGHTLALQSSADCAPDCDRELALCSSCGDPVNENVLALQCLDCDYALHLCCATTFTHPLFVCESMALAYYGFGHMVYDTELRFYASGGTKFRCNACGELGDGYRLSDEDESHEEQFDIHLECFALPGSIRHGCHSHPLFAISSPKKISSYGSTTYCCNICGSEVDPNLWVYCCEQCQYVAHLKCVAGDLLSAGQVSNNGSNLCVISQYEKEQFFVHTEPDETICSKLLTKLYNPCGPLYPIFLRKGFSMEPGLPIGDRSNQPQTTDITDMDEMFSTDALQCPKCERPISGKAYSCVGDWVKNNIDILIYHDQTPVDTEPLTQLDEKLVDQLHCLICNQLIFPPSLSCTECQIFFHKSCAELPRKHTIDLGHTFELLPPPCGYSLIECTYCERPIEGYAYICRRCGNTLDVHCALGAPILKIVDHGHGLFSWPALFRSLNCKACGDSIIDGTICFVCQITNCGASLHVECATLSHMVRHRIHKHALVLEPHLQYGEYYCDACEKELNPCLWAYRCSDDCGDRATSHVSCIVTSNKKRHFRYDEECRGVRHD